MEGKALRGSRILIVEDEYLLADELSAELTHAGAVVLGPLAALSDAMTAVTSEAAIDAAILDTNLRGERVFPVAELLERRHVPFLFTTGYDASQIPARFSHITRCDKPTNVPKVLNEIRRMLS